MQITNLPFQLFITEFEVLLGSNSEQQGFWDDLFSNFTILDLDSSSIRQAIRVQQTLKPKNQMIDIPDLFIAATAIQHNIKIATNNVKHFKRIEQLQILQEI